MSDQQQQHRPDESAATSGLGQLQAAGAGAAPPPEPNGTPLATMATTPATPFGPWEVWTPLGYADLAQAELIVVAIGSGAKAVVRQCRKVVCPPGWLGVRLTRTEKTTRYDFAWGKPVLLLRESMGNPDWPTSKEEAAKFRSAGAAEVREWCVGWGFTNNNHVPTAEEVAGFVGRAELYTPPGEEQKPVAPPTAGKKPEPTWLEVSPDDRCLFCDAAFGCKIMDDDSVAVCRGEGQPGGKLQQTADGSSYWIYAAQFVRKARDARHVEDLTRLITLLHPPGGDRVFEIRVLNIRPERGKPYNATGYFTDPATAAKAALQYERRHPDGVYITPNPPDPLCHARAPDKIIDYQETATGDNDILRRDWLIIDCDPKRPKGVCATAEMVEAAQAFASSVKVMLTDRFGWPEPIEALSGNGQYLLYRVNLPNDEASKQLVSDVLKALNALIAEADGRDANHA